MANLSYADLERELATLPATWIPSLLTAMIERAHRANAPATWIPELVRAIVRAGARQEVFRPGGLEHLVRAELLSIRPQDVAAKPGDVPVRAGDVFGLPGDSFGNDVVQEVVARGEAPVVWGKYSQRLWVLELRVINGTPQLESIARYSFTDRAADSGTAEEAQQLNEREAVIRAESSR